MFKWDNNGFEYWMKTSKYKQLLKYPIIIDKTIYTISGYIYVLLGI